MEQIQRSENTVLAVNELLRILTELHLAHAESERYKGLAQINEVTGLPNQRGFEQYMQRLNEETKRKGYVEKNGKNKMVTLIYGDLEKFRIVNNTYSDEAGNAVLKAVGDDIAKNARPEDFVGNPWGDTYLVLLPTDSQKAQQVVMDRIRYRISHLEIPYKPEGSDENINIHTSIWLTAIAIPVDSNPNEILGKIRKEKLEKPRSNGVK